MPADSDLTTRVVMKIGTRVRITEEYARRIILDGKHPQYVESRRAGGTIVAVDNAVTHMADVRWDGLLGIYACSKSILEVIP